MNIKYFGFSSLQQSTVRFFYNCRGDEVYTASQLQSQCQYLNSSSNEFIQLNQLQDNSILPSDRYVFEVPLHVAAAHDAHILLASDSVYDSIQSGYEIGQLNDVWQSRLYVIVYVRLFECVLVGEEHGRGRVVFTNICTYTNKPDVFYSISNFDINVCVKWMFLQLANNGIFNCSHR